MLRKVPGARPEARSKQEATLRAPSQTDRPSVRLGTSVRIGSFLHDLRTSLKIRQCDLAVRAGVGRQWIVALEQGKPTLELGLVLRTLETLGLELELKPYDPPPAWITRSRQDADIRRYQKEAKRRARRKTTREAARLRRLGENARTVAVDLD